MRQHALLALALAALLAQLQSQPAQAAAAAVAQHTDTASGKVVVLDDENFDILTASGTWLIDVYAPWCSHCRQLEPVWQSLAEEMQDHNVHVAKIDGDHCKMLMLRLGVQAFPSIFLMRPGGRTWSYEGARSMAAMKDFALHGYQQSKSLAFYRAPNSRVGRAIGVLHRFPLYIKKTYRWLKHEKGFADMTILAGMLLVPVILGVLFIAALDAFYSRRPLDTHVHAE